MINTFRVGYSHNFFNKEILKNIWTFFVFATLNLVVELTHPQGKYCVVWVLRTPTQWKNKHFFKYKNNFKRIWALVYSSDFFSTLAYMRHKVASLEYIVRIEFTISYKLIDQDKLAIGPIFLQYFQKKSLCNSRSLKFVWHFLNRLNLN